jgi:prophage regulatory protein
MEEIHPKQLMRIDDVAKFTTLAKSTINLWIIQERFPKPFSPSETVKLWTLDQILGWIDEQQNKEEVNGN